MTKQSIKAQACSNLGRANSVKKSKLRNALKSLAMKDLNAIRKAPFGTPVSLVYEYFNVGRVWC